MHSLAVLHPVGPPERLPPMGAGSVRLLCSLLLAVLVLGAALHGVLDNARGWQSGLLSSGKGVVLGKATGASCEKKAPCHQSIMLVQCFSLQDMSYVCPQEAPLSPCHRSRRRRCCCRLMRRTPCLHQPS